MSRCVVAVTATMLACAPAAAASAASIGLGAHLVPVAGTAASGTFRGSAIVAKRTATMQWRITASGLSGRATRVTLLVGKISLPLCGPCSQLHGTTTLTSPIWRQIALGRATLVVATKAHPAGELGGKIRRL